MTTLSAISDASSGIRMVLAHVIEEAVADATGRNTSLRMDALAYFTGGIYRHHCAHLDIPVRMPPDVARVLEALTPDELRALEAVRQERES